MIVIGTAALTMSRRSMKPPTSTPASDSALIIWPVREVSNSCLASPQHPALQNRREHQAHDDEQEPERDGPIARHQRHHALPAGGLGLNAVMNSSAATSTNSMTGSQKWNFFMTTTSLNSSGA